MANLVMRNINKIYPNGYQAVSDFNMDIEHGEFIVLVGPSGCGKSTMLRMIAGLETISDGDMELGGKRINSVAPADRDIAMVFQNYALYGNMTVYENMGFSLTVRHVGGDEIHERVMEAADVVEMKEILNRKPKNLSGGQRQRVALGRSIVRDASVFLMDEPLSNLDAKLRNQTRKELIELHRKLNSTFIYVTHDQTEAMAMADRIVIMNSGVIQQVGSPTEVYNRPENVFVGGFIGSPSMNFIVGKRDKDIFKSGSMSIALSDDKLERLNEYNKSEVILGIRPEDFMVCKGDEETCFDATVEIVEFLGSTYHVTFNIGDGQIFKAALPTDDVNVGIGDNIRLSIDMRKAHLFDIESEMRLK